LRPDTPGAHRLRRRPGKCAIPAGSHVDSFLLIVKSVSGFITERDFDAAEQEFPGIQRLYARLLRKPRTFLELVWKYEASLEAAAAAQTWDGTAAASSG
jgi:hypothetical protein